MKTHIHLLLISILSFAFTTQTAHSNEPIGISLSGEIHVVAKIQESYFTPFDATHDRAGANYRNDQNFRASGNLVLSHGEPGISKWFAAAMIEFDANYPDSDPSALNIENGIAQQDDEADAALTLGYVFAMYRPFEIDGGRPLGISLGVVPFKATANAAYFHYFRGSPPDEDYIIYTSAAILEVPGIMIDFHLSHDIGFGIGFAKGIDDGSEMITYMARDSASNIVFWGEAKKWNVGLNFALQSISGEAYASKVKTTDLGNTYSEFDHQYSHTVFNTMLTYTLQLNDYALTPGIGYQYTTGEECALEAGLQARDVEATTLSYGFKLETTWLNIPGTLVFLYTKIYTDEIGGITAFQNGTLEATGLITDPSILSRQGTSKSVSSIALLDSDYKFEYVFRVNDTVDFGLFYYALNSKDDDTIKTAYLEQQFAALGPFAAGAANLASEELKIIEWSDTSSYGIYCTFNF